MLDKRDDRTAAVPPGFRAETRLSKNTQYPAWIWRILQRKITDPNRTGLLLFHPVRLRNAPSRDKVKSTAALQRKLSAFRFPLSGCSARAAHSLFRRFDILLHYIIPRSFLHCKGYPEFFSIILLGAGVHIVRFGGDGRFLERKHETLRVSAKNFNLLQPVCAVDMLKKGKRRKFSVEYG